MWRSVLEKFCLKLKRESEAAYALAQTQRAADSNAAPALGLAGAPTSNTSPAGSVPATPVTPNVDVPTTTASTKHFAEPAPTFASPVLRQFAQATNKRAATPSEPPKTSVDGARAHTAAPAGAGAQASPLVARQQAANYAAELASQLSAKKPAASAFTEPYKAYDASSAFGAAEMPRELFSNSEWAAEPLALPEEVDSDGLGSMRSLLAELG